MIKGKTRITVNRETLKALLEEHISSSMLGSYNLHEFTIGRTGTIELVITPAVEPALPLEPEPQL